MTLTFTILLGILVVIFGYTTFNLLSKNEKAEDIIVSQKSFIDKLDEHITFSNKLKKSKTIYPNLKKTTTNGRSKKKKKKE